MTNTRKKIAGKTSKSVKNKPKQAYRPAKLSKDRAGSFTEGNPREVSLPEVDLETVEERRKAEFVNELQNLIKIIDEQIT